ncbi:hypothetical protein C2E23DRAFT_226306 [Lenzites betulinus]|nr:hypothetical protein C2E23DRAFT_226306 [Lenzites betulinus]
MKALKRIFSSSATPHRSRTVSCRYCQQTFVQKDAVDQFCSRRCLTSYNSRPAQSHRNSPASAHQPRMNYYEAAIYSPRGSPQPSQQSRSHMMSRHASGSPYMASQPSTPTYSPGHSRQLYYPSSPSHSPGCSQRVYSPSYFSGTPYSYSAYPSPCVQFDARYRDATPISPLTAVPYHLQMERSSSSPAKARSTQRPHRLEAPKRPSSAGHTPGTMLRPLPVVASPSASRVTALPADAQPHLGHNRIYRSSERSRSTQLKIAAPSPLRAQPSEDIIASLEERIEMPVPSPSEWHFKEPPSRPSISSTSSRGDREIHGGFYDAEGNPVDIQFGQDLSWTVADTTSGWKTASTATLVSTQPRGLELDIGTPIYPTGGYVPRQSATPRPAAASRRGPRPRSNSFGGY